MMLVSLFHLRDVFTKEDTGDTLRIVSSVLLLVMLIAFTIFTFFFTRKNKAKLNEPEFI